MWSGAEVDSVRLFVQPITDGNRHVILRTADGVRIHAAYEPGPGRGGPAIVVAHGFTGQLERPAIRRAARVFAQRAAVITFSFRGHGGSGGASTVGDREVLDLAAAVAWARSLGHPRVGTVGFSMGGSVVLRYAALYGSDGGKTPARARRTEAPPEAHAQARTETQARTATHTDAVVAVSSPARWFYRGTAPMRRLHWVVTRRSGRLVGRYGLKTRIHHGGWNPVPLSPVEAVPLIAPTPLLIVHGDRDPYFPVDHPRSLAAASAGTADLWLERGMGHAEHATDEALLSRIGVWVASALG